MNTLVSITVFSAAFLLWLYLYQLLMKSRAQTRLQLKQIAQIGQNDQVEIELNEPFSHRVLKPIYQGFLNRLAKLAPDALKRNYNQRIIVAGLSHKLNAIRLLAIQFLSGTIVTLLMYITMPHNRTGILAMIGAGLLAFLLPASMITRKGQTRQEAIVRSLPDMLDLLYVSVEAGLGFDMAMKRAGSKMKGPLSEEILKALDEISKGRKREDALRGIAVRTKVADLSAFVSAVIQTEQLGSNIANMLRVQSTVMRQKRRQRAEERANKLAVKMLFPIVFFIFPAIFVVLLAPSLLRIMNVLGGMVAK